VTRWRALKVGVFGYTMNAMGDIRVDEQAPVVGDRVEVRGVGAVAARAQHALEILNPGRHAEAWPGFSAMAGLEFAQA
jgi:hypothetical protein